MPPIDPPTTAAQRSMPMRVGERRAAPRPGRGSSGTGSASPTRGRRGRATPGPVRALAAAEHVRRDDEPLGRVDRACPGPTRPVHQPAVGCPGPAGPDVAVAGQRVQHEHGVARVGVELAPGLVGDADGRKRAAALERRRRRSRRTAGGRGSSPSRQAPDAGGLPSSARRLASVTNAEGRCPRVSASPCRGHSAWMPKGPDPRVTPAGPSEGGATRDARGRRRPCGPRRSRPRGRPSGRRRSRGRPRGARGPGVTPVVSCCSGVSCECVVDAGWMIRLRTSPMLARWLNSVTFSTSARPASTPPLSSNDSTAPTPFGAYLLAAAYHGLDGRPGVVDRGDVVVVLEPLGDLLRVLHVALDAQATASRCPG